MRKRILGSPLHVFLLPAFPIVHVFSFNHNRLSVNELFFTLVPLLALVAIVWLAARFLLGCSSRGDLIISTTCFFTLSFGYYLPRDKGITLLIWLTIFAVLLMLISLYRRIDQRWIIAANIFAIVIMIPASLYMGLAPHWWKRHSLRQLAKTSFPDLPLPATDEIEKRDIYYFVLDRYARGDQLKELYQFDNAPFLEALKQRGFLVLDQSFANYQRTAHSLASSLNLDYLDGLSQPVAKNSKDWVPLYELLSDFRLERFLRKQGYSFLFFGNWWGPMRLNGHADENHNYWAVPELARVVFENSVPGAFSYHFGFLDPRKQQCERIWRQLDSLKEISQRQELKFVFAHLLVPHPPFVFSREGHCLEKDIVATQTRRDAYIAQVEYINSELANLIDEIVGNSARTPIILIQSDEGPWPERMAGDEISRLGRDVTSVDWLNVPPHELKEKMAILNAILLPGDDLEIQRTWSPVNVTRYLLTEAFGVALPILEDRHFVFPDNDHLYEFVPVTQKLHEGQDSQVPPDK